MAVDISLKQYAPDIRTNGFAFFILFTDFNQRVPALCRTVSALLRRHLQQRCHRSSPSPVLCGDLPSRRCTVLKGRFPGIRSTGASPPSRESVGTSLLDFLHFLPAAAAGVLVATLSGCGALRHLDFTATALIGAAIAFALLECHSFISFTQKT